MAHHVDRYPRLGVPVVISKSWYEIVLLTADGVGTNEIMRRTDKSKTCVWRWQERFLEDGFDGLLRDKTRPSRIKPLRAETAERVVALTLGSRPGKRPIGPAP